MHTHTHTHQHLAVSIKEFSCAVSGERWRHTWSHSHTWSGTPYIIHQYDRYEDNTWTGSRIRCLSFQACKYTFHARGRKRYASVYVLEHVMEAPIYLPRRGAVTRNIPRIWTQHYIPKSARVTSRQHHVP